jgi:RNA polymerase sigma-70 factor (ECF subfamily)
LPEDRSFVQDDFELMLLSLPEDYRVEVHLFYGERMSVRQIAQVMGKSENAVRVRLTRARQMLRKSLQGGDLA